jgi:hypothetical protein
VRSTLSVLAAALVMAAGTGCSEDKDDDGAAASSTTAPATTTEQNTAATEPATTERAETTTTGTTTAAQPKPSRWAMQVDAACRPWQAKLNAVKPPSDPTQLAASLASTLPLIRREIAAVKGIKLPMDADEAATAKLFVAGLQRIERELTKYVAALRADNAQAVQSAIVQVNTAGAETRTLAASLQITHCGAPGG